MSSNQHTINSDYWEEAASRETSGVIERWSFSADRTPSPPIRILPDGGLSILFSAGTMDGRWEATVFGATTRASLTQPSDPLLQVQIHLTPGAASRILGARPPRMRDHAISLDAFWGSESKRLLSNLERANSWDARKSAIEEAFIRPASACEKSAAALVRNAVDLIRAKHGQSRISEICDSLAINPRRLERLFRDEIGISPKLFARIVRFRAARESIRSGDPCAQIALMIGFSDQAHMTREFRAFASVPPSFFASNHTRSTEAGR